MKKKILISFFILSAVFSYSQDSIKLVRDTLSILQNTSIEHGKIIYTDTISKNGKLYNIIPLNADTLRSKNNGVTFVVIPEMADGLRADGKIYVVVAVLVTILLGIVLFLMMIDRKVSDIEKKLKNKK